MPSRKPTPRSSSAKPAAGAAKASSSSPRRTPSRSEARGRPSAAASAPGLTDSARDQLQRFLDPREVVVVTRDRLQEALDDAVERGRMTRDDAGDLLAELLRRGRQDLDSVLDGAREATRTGVSGSADRVLREVERARRATGLGPAFAIAGYDELTAAQVTGRLGELDAAGLRTVRDYERRNANRKSVLRAVEQKLA